MNNYHLAEWMNQLLCSGENYLDEIEEFQLSYFAFPTVSTILVLSSLMEKKISRTTPKIKTFTNPTEELQNHIKESAATASSCVLLQEPLRPEVFGIFPVGRVVGEPPGVDEDHALGRDVIAAKLGIVEIHVADKERDGHA
ncbi:hypothetical protein KSP40_PGU004496 [Platanthera guangdongensis]|uniref:Uncharacterized protein n=1 Tax=Platanthera guangdongensis TaxID=2320717 RepID=A0ABR2LN05_9ASPA